MKPSTALVIAVVGVVLIWLVAIALGDERHGFTPSPRLRGEAYRHMRDAAFASAGVPTSMQCHRGDSRPDCLILDHIWPLCGGGGNAPSNLQLQRRDIAAAKDDLEKDFCAGRLPLEQARLIFVRTSK